MISSHDSYIDRHTIRKLSSTNIIQWNLQPQNFVGFVIRDYHGFPLLTSSKKIGHSNALHTKALALRVGLHVTHIHGHSKI